MYNEKSEIKVAQALMHNGKKDSNKDVVEKSMGIMGRWQIWICCVIFLCKLPIAWHQLNIVLVGAPVTFSCIDNSTDKCSPDCPSIVFDKSTFTNTILMQWNLICDRAALANLAQTITMLGILVGNCAFGILSDKFGRRGPLIGAVIIQLISGTAAAFSPWFWMFLLFRFICAVATGGTMVTSFVLVMEVVGTKWRTPLGILYQIPFNLGHLSLALIGYYIRDWHHIQLAITLPSLILISYYWIILESPRWLLATGQDQEAIHVMEKVARCNRLPYDAIKGDVADHINKRKIEHKKGRFLDLVLTSNMRLKTICVGFNWIVCGLCFFGGAQYMGQLGGNVFVNIALSALTQIPGTLVSIWLMQYAGRRYTLMGSNLLSAATFLLITVVPMHSDWPRIMLGSIGMFGLSITFPTVYIYSGELYPTVIRNIGVGSGSMCARIGSMLAPFVAGLGSVQPWLPPTIFGLIPLIGAILSCFLPETVNCSLPETLEDAENFGKSGKPSTIQNEIQLNEARS